MGEMMRGYISIFICSVVMMHANQVESASSISLSKSINQKEVDFVVGRKFIDDSLVFPLEFHQNEAATFDTIAVSMVQSYFLKTASFFAQVAYDRELMSQIRKFKQLAYVLDSDTSHMIQDEQILFLRAWTAIINYLIKDIKLQSVWTDKNIEDYSLPYQTTQNTIIQLIRNNRIALQDLKKEVYRKKGNKDLLDLIQRMYHQIQSIKKQISLFEHNEFALIYIQLLLAIMQHVGEIGKHMLQTTVYDPKVQIALMQQLYVMLQRFDISIEGISIL